MRPPSNASSRFVEVAWQVHTPTSHSSSPRFPVHDPLPASVFELNLTYGMSCTSTVACDWKLGEQGQELPRVVTLQSIFTAFFRSCTPLWEAGVGTLLLLLFFVFDRVPSCSLLAVRMSPKAFTTCSGERIWVFHHTRFSGLVLLHGVSPESGCQDLSASASLIVWQGASHFSLHFFFCYLWRIPNLYQFNCQDSQPQLRRLVIECLYLE